MSAVCANSEILRAARDALHAAIRCHHDALKDLGQAYVNGWREDHSLEYIRNRFSANHAAALVAENELTAARLTFAAAEKVYNSWLDREAIAG